ncbi:hypothetical protein HDK77DRAFT_447287 [Phyllosticta capitalensis]
MQSVRDAFAWLLIFPLLKPPLSWYNERCMSTIGCYPFPFYRRSCVAKTEIKWKRWTVDFPLFSSCFASVGEQRIKLSTSTANGLEDSLRPQEANSHDGELVLPTSSALPSSMRNKCRKCD